MFAGPRIVFSHSLALNQVFNLCRFPPSPVTVATCKRIVAVVVALVLEAEYCHKVYSYVCNSLLECLSNKVRNILENLIISWQIIYLCEIANLLLLEY